MKLTRLLAAAALATLALTACGDDNGDDDAPVESPTAQTDQASQADQADQAIVEAALLTLQDFPVGWEAAPAANDGDDTEMQEEIAACVGVAWGDLYGGDTAKAESPEFTSTDDQRVSMAVHIDPDETRAASIFAIQSSPEFRDCAADSLTKSVQDMDVDGAEAGELVLTDLSVGAIGDESIAYRLTVPVTAEGFTMDIVMETAVVRVARGAVTFTSMGFGSALPTSDLAGYIELSAQRLAAALS